MSLEAELQKDCIRRIHTGNRRYRLELVSGHQSFGVSMENLTLAQAKWTERMLTIALRRLVRKFSTQAAADILLHPGKT